jgi:beta-lactamase regulating signal transducer with metallopeptidase domain
MKPFTRLSWLLAPALALCLVSCKRQQRVDATQPLQQSFESAGPEVQQAIAKVNASLKANNIAEATQTLAALVSQRALTDSQRQALGLALQQINQAVAANPSLDTKEMYQLRAQMFRAFDHGPRQ